MEKVKDKALNTILSLIQNAEDPSYFFIACKHATDEKNYNLYLYAHGGFVCRLSYEDGTCEKIDISSIKKYKDHCPTGKLDDYVGPSVAERLLFLEKEWEAIEEAYRNRAEGIKLAGTTNNKQYKERNLETKIAHMNNQISSDCIAFFDMEHNNTEVKAKADLVGALWDGEKLQLLLTEYKCTYGALRNFEKHYTDMISLIDNENSRIRLKEDNLQSLKNMIKLELVKADDDLKKTILSLRADQVELGMLFLFSNRKEIYKQKTPKALKNGYSGILKGIEGKYEGVTYHLCIPDDTDYKIIANQDNLKKFSEGGGFNYGI